MNGDATWRTLIALAAVASLAEQLFHLLVVYESMAGADIQKVKEMRWRFQNGPRGRHILISAACLYQVEEMWRWLQNCSSSGDVLISTTFGSCVHGFLSAFRLQQRISCGRKIVFGKRCACLLTAA
jgi:hypothetical protein